MGDKSSGIVSVCYKPLENIDVDNENLKLLQEKWNIAEDQILSAILFIAAY